MVYGLWFRVLRQEENDLRIIAHNLGVEGLGIMLRIEG